MKKNESKREHAIKSVKVYSTIDEIIETIEHQIEWMNDRIISDNPEPFSYEYNTNLEKQALQELINILKDIDY